MDAPYPIHRLSVGDLARAEELLEVFAAAFADADEDRGPPPEAHLRRVLGDPHVILLVALAGDSVAGGILAYELPKFRQAHSEVYLYDLAVAAPFRRRGIATALIARLRAIAGEIGAPVVYVQADPEDELAVALYAGLGACAEVFHFEFAVPTGGTR